MEVGAFSSLYQVRPIEDEDVRDVLELCRRNTVYYEYCPPFVTEESIRRDRTALPPRKGMEDKYYVGFYEDGRIIAVMDMIDAYPNRQTAFIGFFMTDVSVQRKGVGSGIITELCDYLRVRRYKAVRLGWVKGNSQSEGFWRRNGFVETGDTYDTGGYTVIVAERDLKAGLCSFDETGQAG